MKLQHLCAAVALLCGAAAGQSPGTPQGNANTTANQSTSELIDHIKNLKSAQAAVQRLATLSEAEVLPLLTASLRKDVAWADSDAAREMAFRLLVTLGPRLANGQLKIENPQQIELLQIGAQDPAPSIRSLCAQALGRVNARNQAAAVGTLVAVLNDGEPAVVINAISSLVGFKSDAKPALAKLREILAFQGEEATKKFDRVRKQDSLSSVRDLEIEVRSAAAFARIQIGGGPEDFELYPRLDARGVEAVLLALTRYLYISTAEVVKAPENVQKEIVYWMRRGFEDSTRPDRSRIDGLFALAYYISKDGPAEARAQARAVLELASVDAKADIQKTARALIEQIDRKK